MKSFPFKLGARREDGQVLAFVAVSMTVLVLAAALVIDPSNAFVSKQKLQNTADATALGAAGDLSTSGCFTDACIGSYVNKWSGLNGGPTNMQNCSTSSPPCYTWPYDGNQSKIEVRLQSGSTNFFGSLYGLSATAVHARAVAVAGRGEPPHANFLSLNTSCDNHTLLIRSSGQLIVTDPIYVDSCNASNDGFDVFGTGGFIRAPAIKVVGGWETHGGTAQVGGITCPLTSSNGQPSPTTAQNQVPGCPWIGQPRVADPFGGVQPPSAGPAACAGTTTYPASSYTPTKQYLDGSLDASTTTIVASGTAVQAGDMIQIENEQMQVTNVSPGPGNEETLTVTRAINGTTAASHTEPMYNVSDIDRGGNSATLTTATNNTLATGKIVHVSGVDLSSSDAFPFNGVQTLTGATTTTASYANNGDNLPPYVTITTAQLTNNVATLTTSVPHGFSVGDSIYLTGVAAPFSNGTYTLTAVPSPRTFSFALTHADVASESVNGTVGYRVTNEVISNNVATLTTGSPHHLKVGDRVYVDGVANINNSDYVVTAVPSSTTFSFAFSHANVTSTAVSAGLAWGRTITGTITGPLLEIMQVIPTTPGTASDPTPCTISAGSPAKTLQPGTYYGGICIGLPSGTSCSDANCASDFTSTAYSPAQTLVSAISSTQTTITASGTAISSGDTIQIGSERLSVLSTAPGNGGQETLTVDRGYMNTTAASANAGTAIKKVVPNGGTVNVTFAPGIYVIAGGGLYVCGGARLSAPNVLIYNTVDSSSPSGAGALNQIETYTTGSVTLGAQTQAQSPQWFGLTIFQDRNQELGSNLTCNQKNSQSSNAPFRDVSLVANSNGLNGISGTVYAPDQVADFADQVSGTTNLAVLTGCIYIDGADSTFEFQSSGLFGVGASLGE